ncbi:MAG: serine aminopeptidase domain-containing protein [Myxococcota bacterium]
MSRTPRPVFFGPRERPCFGWIHLAEGGNRSVGLVLCKPFGYEGICAQRSVRHFAEHAAAIGLPAIRFDYEGTGDSAGSDRDPARVDAWVRSVHAAIDELKRRSGVTRVIVLGLRLGATLGALASAERSDVASFIGIAPVVSAKAYLRELRALQMALALSPPPEGFRAPEGEREAAGFAISAETQEKLTTVDLARAPVRPAGRVLLLDRDDLPMCEGWAKALRAAGDEVDHQRVQGFTELVLDPHHAQVPDSIVRLCMAFMRESLERAAPAEGIATSVAVDESDTSQAEFVVDGVRIRETAAWLSAEHPLFGVLSEPAAAPSGPRKAFLLLNSGAIHHIGPNRMYVALARSWAARGHTVLRADLSGLGDSKPRPGEAENVVYSSHAQEDVGDALAFLQSRPGVSKVYAVGLCSGAYNSFKAAVAGHRMHGVVPINPLIFFWKEGMSLDLPQQHEVVQDAQRYSRMVRRGDAWKRLFTGRVKLSRVAEVLLQQSGILLAGYARGIGRRLGRPFPDDLGVELEIVADRDINMQFIFAAADPGVELLRVQGGRTVQRLAESGKLARHFITGANHTFTAIWMQEELSSTLATVISSFPA